MKVAALALRKSENIRPSIVTSSPPTSKLEAKIKQIWASPEAASSFPCSVGQAGSTLNGNDLSKFDESLGRSVEEILAEGECYEIPLLVEAIKMMRPHERFRMAKLTGRFKTGRAYFACYAQLVWERETTRQWRAVEANESCLFQGRRKLEGTEDGDDEFVLKAHEAMVSWIEAQAWEGGYLGRRSWSQSEKRQT